MKAQTSLMAKFYTAAFTERTKVHVRDEQDAERLARQWRCFFFETYTQTTAELDGQVLTGKPQNYSSRRYVGIDRLYTTREVIAQYENDLANLRYTMREDFSRTIAREAIEGVIEEYKSKYGADDRFIPEPGRAGDFIGLKQNKKAFDSKGVQVWPQPK